MKGFFDMHCHTLFGVDDGAKDFAMSLAMLDIAYSDGIRQICFTPHCNPYDRYPDIDATRYAFESIDYFVKSKNLDIKVSLGSEIMYYSDFAADIERGICRGLCSSKYVLFEFYESADFSEIFDAAERAFSMGYKPVIAHAERYDCILKKPSRLLSLSERGILLQFNSGLFTKSPRRTVFKEMRYGKIRNIIFSNKLPCMVSSDAHGITRRIPKVSFAYEEFLKKTDKAYANEVFFDIPSKIFYQNSD